MTTANNAPISFRLADDELELLRQHQEDGEKSLNLTAKRLLLNALGVDAKKSSLQFVNTVGTNQIKELIEVAVQEKLENLTIAGVAEQFNGLLGELQELKKQMEALKSSPPAAVPEQLTTDNGQLTKDVECDRSDSDFKPDTESPVTADIASLLGIEDILSGSPYDLNYLNDHVRTQLNEHKSQIEAALKIKLSLSEPKYICREFNRILRAMGHEIKNKQIKKIETYWVVPK